MNREHQRQSELISKKPPTVLLPSVNPVQFRVAISGFGFQTQGKFTALIGRFATSAANWTPETWNQEPTRNSGLVGTIALILTPTEAFGPIGPVASFVLHRIVGLVGHENGVG
jgi:hypothetical protein